MAKYRIIERNKVWKAYKVGILSFFGIYNIWNQVPYVVSIVSAETCKKYLHKELFPNKKYIVEEISSEE